MMGSRGDHMHRTSSHQRAFTLVEMSVVLVIIGLLAGGIMAGKSLVHASELRAVSSEFNRYAIALGSFKDKYGGALPGDMRNAVAYWGAAAGDPNAIGPDPDCDAVTNAVTPPTTTGTETCNGNGNRVIDYAENPRAWQQLHNAGMLNGSFSGAGMPDDDSSTFNPHAPRGMVPGFNTPASRLSPAGWYFALWNEGEGADATGTQLILALWNAYGWSAVLSSTDAQNIDAKMDDGEPLSGTVQTFPNTFPWSPYCTTTDNTQYNVSYHGTICALIFTTGF